jgi:hypothetical protein
MIKSKRYRLLLLAIKVADIILERKEMKRLEDDYYDYINIEINKKTDKPVDIKEDKH